MRKGNFIIILSAAVIIFIIIGFFFLNDTRVNERNVDEISELVILDEGESMEVIPDESMDSESVMDLATGEGSLVAELIDVSGGESSGVAYLYTDSTLYHYAIADLPEPASGSVYEGWLVRRTPALQFFSTGVMEVDEEGMYSLSFMTEGEYPGYDFVVITEEAIVDATPEAHILEGTLE